MLPSIASAGKDQDAVEAHSLYELNGGTNGAGASYQVDDEDNGSSGEARAFPSLLVPPPRSVWGRIVATGCGAYNRLVARAGPYLPVRLKPIPHDAYLPLYAADEWPSANGDPGSDTSPTSIQPSQPNPAAVYSHLTQQDTLARLGLSTQVSPDVESPNALNHPAAPPADQSDSAGTRFVHIQHGLGNFDVLKRREQSGRNEFAQRKRDSPLEKLIEQLSEPMILLLLGSAVVSFAIGERDDAVSITLAIVIVVTVGWAQEQRSEQSLEALQSLVPNFCHLIRPDPPPLPLSLTSSVNGSTGVLLRAPSTVSLPPGAAATAAVPGGVFPPVGAQSAAPGAKVLADELVPGDVVTFSTGDRIPADIRLFHAVQLEVDESTLTGEITPRKKITSVILPQWGPHEVEEQVARLQARSSAAPGSAPYPEQGSEAGVDEQSKDNIVFMGTMVKSGYGRGVVVGTGLQTEFGSVFSMVDNVEEKRTPLQRSMDDLAAKLTMASFGVIGVIFLVGAVQRRSLLELATIAISLAVAAIPEGLPIVVTVTLALGVLRMSRSNAIVKRLPSVETLGSVSVICTDKTGTLTENRMTVTKLYTLQDGIVSIDGGVSHAHRSGQLTRGLGRTLLVGNLCNRAVPDRSGTLVGSPTERAMVDVLALFGQEDRRRWFRPQDEVPFDTQWKYMSVFGPLEAGAAEESWQTRSVGYTKGAPEAVLERCSHVVSSQGTTIPMTEALTQQIEQAVAELASNGLRILACATGPPRNGELSGGPEVIRANMTFCGLQAMQDPPRQGVKTAIEELSHSGVHIIMVTGDAPTTATGIAKQLGILHAPSFTPARARTVSSTPHLTSSGVMTGSQVDQLSVEQLREIVGSISVFARTTPKHKMAIVSALQQAQEVVAMTGDGVNDAPALKMADIGIAMGTGTDVAKEAADVILVQDNFVTICQAVQEGKAIFGNIQHFLAFQLSTSIAALVLILLSILAGFKLPLNAMQVLLINIACDGPPAQSLGVDPADNSVFRKPPRPKGQPVLDKRVGIRIAFAATLILSGTLFVYLHEAAADGSPDERDMAMTFVTFVSLDLITAVQSRGLHVGLFANTVMAMTIGVSYAVLLALIYFPPLQAIFQTIPLSLADLLYVTGLTAAVFGLHAIRRDYERQYDDKKDRATWDGSVA